MKKGYFVTGTDTSVGKTYAMVELLNYFNERSMKTAALKPIASGSEKTPNGLQNQDALQLMGAMSMKFAYEQVNPFAFELPLAPHLAASPLKLTVSETMRACRAVLSSDYDVVFIEGAGGWLVPLNDQETFADLAAAFGLSIILVVGLRLGCLNHALLTYENIKSRQLPFAGWIVNHLDSTMLSQKENIKTLETLFAMPPLGVIPYNGRFQAQTEF